MSRTVDERIVSMQFNNKNFEKNVAVTMATLEKLKQKSNLEGAVKGFQNLGSAAKKVDLSGLDSGVQTLQAKFSSLDVVGVTALANIANSAVNAGKRMIKALTLDPISQGFSEYELKMNSIQTIKASTGESISTISKYLEELNVYADRTIYSFSDMTSNIGKFTNAGVKLKDAVKAIQGISNEAAVSGANANEASRAMYNFAQALSAGYVKLIDWKSIENANMATVEFKNELIKTGVELGTLKKKGDMYVSTTENMQGKISEAFNSTRNFNESLNHQWMSTEVLTKTLGKYSDETTELGKKAFAAAQDVKTFSQLMDTLKEAVGSGWATTFEIIFGDMEEAKKLWSGVNNVISPIIDSISDFRNQMLRGALSSKWNDFTSKINEAGISTNRFEKSLIDVAKKHDIALDEMIKKEGSLKNVIDKGLISRELLIETLKSFVGINKEAGKSTEDLNKKLKKFQKVVDEVWKGKHGNGENRVKALTKAGYKYSEVQELVNKTTNGRKLKLEDLSKTQLKSIGYTDKECESIKKLSDEAEKSGTPLNKLIDSLSKPTGRELLFESIHNMVKPVITILQSLGTAWTDAFPPNGNFLYKIIESFHSFSTHLIISKESAEDLTRTFKGMFALLDLISKVVGGVFGTGFKIAAKIMSELWKALGLVNVNILKVTGNIGDAIVAVRDWVEQHSILNNVIEVGIPIIVNMCKALVTAIKYIIEFVKIGWQLPVVQNSISKIGDAFKYVSDLINKHFGKSIQAIRNFVSILTDVNNFSPNKLLDGFKNMIKAINGDFANLDFSTTGKNIVQGLSNGIKAGIDGIMTIASSMAEYLINSFRTKLGIHSPSTVFFAFGKNIIQGLLNGIQNGMSFVIDAIKKLGSMIAEAFSGLDFSDVMVIGTGITSFFLGRGMIKGFSKLTEILGKPLEGVSSVLTSFAGVLDSFSGIVNAKKLEVKSEAMLNMAKSIGILVVALVVMTHIDTDKLWNSIGALTVIAGIMAGLSFAISKMPDIKSVGKMSVVMISLSVSLAIMSTVIKKIGELDFIQALQGVGGILSLMLGMAAVTVIVNQTRLDDNINKAGKLFIKMSIAIGLLALVIKACGQLESSELIKGATVIGGAFIMFEAMAKITSFSGDNISKAGSMFVKMATAIGLLVLVMKLCGTLSLGEMIKGAAVIAGAGFMFAKLADITKNSGKNADKVGKLFFKFSTAIGIIAIAMKLVGSMSMGDIVKGGIVIAGAGAMLMLLVNLTKGAGKNIDKAGSLFLKFGIAVGVLAVALRLLVGLSTGDIVKGGIVIAGVGVLFAALIKVSKYAGEHASTAGSMLMKMGVAIGILAFSLRLIATLSAGDLAKGFVVVSGLMVLFTALIAVSSFAGRFADSAGKMLIKVSAAILILVGAIAVLSLIEPSKIAIGTASITALMGMFALLMKISNSFSISGKGIGGMFAITAIIGLLAGVIALLSKMPVQSVLGSAAGLSALLLSLATAAKILSTIKIMSPIALGAAVAMTAIVGLLGGILYLLKGLPIDTTLSNTKALSTLLLSLSGACVILSGVGLTGPSAFIGIGALVTLIGSMGTLMGAIGALTTYFPDLELFLNKGIKILNSIANGIGSFIGNIIDGFLTAATDGLPNIGTTLSKFMTNLKPFLDGVKGIDESTANGMKALAQAILILTATEVLDALTSWFTGDASLEEFAKELIPFGTKLVEFAQVTSGIKGDNFNNVAQAAKALVEMANSIPSEGGLKDKILGVKDLTAFGSSLEAFGTSLVKYSNSVSGKNINVSDIKISAEGAKALVEVAKAIPAEGGFWQILTGEHDLGKFGKKLTPFGKGISEYSKVVSDKTFKVEAIKSSAEAAKAMVEVANAIPSDGGIWGWLTGDNDLSDFGKKLISFAKSIGTYSESASKIKSEAVSSSTKAISELVTLIKNISNTDISGVNDFIDAVNELSTLNIAGVVTNFSKDISGIALKGQAIIEGIVLGMDSKSDEVIKKALSIINKAISALTKKNPEFKKTGAKYMTELSSGMDSKKSTVEKTSSNMIKSAKNATDGYVDDFSRVGKAIAQGFANGIHANAYLSATRAKEMARQAENAAKKQLDSHSPSKKFETIGTYVPQGFAKGISMFGSAVKKSVVGMSNNAISNTENAMSKVLSITDADMDMNPTIRPVLDLSDIKTGAGKISGMLGTTQSVGVMSNLKAIDSAMNKRIQNRSNDEIISAISKLGKDISKMSGTSYSIGGVSYQEGSQVADTIKALVRAMKVERRV